MTDKNKKHVISFRTDDEVLEQLNYLINLYEKKNGIKFTYSQYINYLVENTLKEKIKNIKLEESK